MYQLYGFKAFNQYALSMGTADDYYGAYHLQQQLHGRGDGSDGLSDNRLTLACPGKPHSKPATVNQDVACVSVRGQAFIDWMKATPPAPPPAPQSGRKLRFVPLPYRSRH